jgi:lipopolysaccharide/colanic/teichoic acid biosynthesis glycosyltransferase/glycosyltransferase involved in cell wall biosynthesis
VNTRTGKVKIVRVIARLNIGGPAIHVINLTTGVDPNRFESILVTGTENPGEGSFLDLAVGRGIRPIVVPEIVGEATFKLRDVRALITLYRLIRREKAQIVHTHTAKAGFLGRLAARLAGVPVIIHTYHGYVLRGYYGSFTTSLLRRMERALARITDRIIAVSEQVKRDLVAYGVARDDQITVIPLGFDLAPFLDGAAHRGAFRRELGLEDGLRLVGIVGRLFPIKNHRLFLDAAVQVSGEDRTVRFVIVGDGILRREMEERAGRLGLADRVVFTGWRHDLPRIYPDLDVLVVSSKNEGTPVSAIEAMATGCPVVATRVGGLPDLIEDGETGCLVPSEDVSALAEGILRLLRDRERARRMGVAARASVCERFRATRLVSDIEGLYTELVARSRAPTGSWFRDAGSQFLKRAFDLLLSSIGLVLAAPVWAVIALAVKFHDGGPVFFAQDRWGQAGKRIRVLKFRTMIPDASAGGVSVQAVEHDPRITRVGWILRATALDELPQLLNIWKGEMSFVGPRALPINEQQGREQGDVPDEKIPGFHDRLQVRPGLTGIAQIFAPRDVPRRHKFRYDLFYVHRRSFWLDLRLIVLSFWITFRGAWERRGKKF